MHEIITYKLLLFLGQDHCLLMDLYRETLVLFFLLLVFGLCAHLFRATLRDAQVLVSVFSVFGLLASQLSQQTGEF